MMKPKRKKEWVSTTVAKKKIKKKFIASLLDLGGVGSHGTLTNCVRVGRAKAHRVFAIKILYTLSTVVVRFAYKNKYVRWVLRKT